MAQFTLFGPDTPILSKEDVCSLLRVSPNVLDGMVAEGRFPRGMKMSHKTPAVWQAVDIAAWLHLAGKMFPDEEIPKKSSAPVDPS